MVMPLGPDFARALGISTAHLGLIAGSYTAAAAVAGIVGARFLDRFDRRKALGVAIFGLVTGTAAGALAQGLASLVIARAIAGAFGGPATSIALSIIADVVPPARRGRAMGAVMGAFSVASVLGVPLGLRLAQRGRLAAPVHRRRRRWARSSSCWRCARCRRMRGHIVVDRVVGQASRAEAFGAARRWDDPPGPRDERRW